MEVLEEQDIEVSFDQQRTGVQISIDKDVFDKLPEEAQNVIVNHFSRIQSENAIEYVRQQMRDIPVLESEKPRPDDTHVLERVILPKDGGALTFMGGHELPYRGFPTHEAVEKIDIIKKLGKASVSGLYHSLKNRKWILPFLIPSVLVFRDLLTAGVYTFYRLIERFQIKTIRLSQAMRELHRAFSEVGCEGRIAELRNMLRDLLCNILEMDNAYRFRAQDLLEELDKELLQKNIIKELKRLIVLAQSREKTQEIRDMWKLIDLFVSFYLRFDRKLLALVRDILLEINIEKFKLTPEDIQFCKPRKDYTFGFQL